MNSQETRDYIVTRINEYRAGLITKSFLLSDLLSKGVTGGYTRGEFNGFDNINQQWIQVGRNNE